MYNKYNLIKKIAIIFFIMIIIFFAGFAISQIPQKILTKEEGKKKLLSASSWYSDLVEINTTGESDITYINIKQFVNINNNGLINSINDPATIVLNNVNYKILINDGLDVYYFSELCNPKLANGTVNNYYNLFLGYHYILGSDIDYTDASRNYLMLRPIGWGKNPFRGTFDGQGFTISNIFFVNLSNQAEYEDNYSEIVEGMEYSMLNFAWFSQNTGTICNLGIINANMILPDIFDPMISAAVLVGENQETGIVDHVYIQDLRGEGSGLTCDGGYEISMLMSVNSGTLTNSYVAVNRIISTSVTISSQNYRHPIVNYINPTAIMENIYFDNSILAHSYKNINDNRVSGIQTVDFTKTEPTDENDIIFNYTDAGGNSLGWYSNCTYDTRYIAYLRLTYPILKGFEKRTSNGTTYFLIDNAPDLIYFNNLTNLYEPFRSANYQLTKTIDMKSVSEGSYKVNQSVFSGILDGGNYQSDNGTPCILQDGSTSSYNSIINLTIEKGSSYNGYHCYGLFGVLRGTIQNLNLVNTYIRPLDLATNNNFNEINTIGLLCGLQEAGTIDNVNVQGTIIYTANTNNNTANGLNTTVENLGRAYIGGLCGYATGGIISQSTTNGTIDGNYVNHHNTFTNNIAFSIGGLVGRIENLKIISECLNTMDLYGIRFPSASVNDFTSCIGGVIGSGNTITANCLQNDGKIVVGKADTTYRYGILYVGGVFGYHQSASEAVGMFTNNADIDVHIMEIDITVYIAGCLVNNNSGTITYESLSSAGTLSITNDRNLTVGTANHHGTNIEAAGVLYVKDTTLTVTGVYQLKQQEQYVGYVKQKVDLLPQNIDMSIMENYAPCVFSNNDTEFITLSRSYNDRDHNYITTQNVNFYNLYCSGNTTGPHIIANNIRNDGDILVNFTHNAALSLSQYTSTLSDYKKLKVYGCMEVVSSDCTAQNLYNGGNIHVTMTNGLDVRYNVYASGICYKTESGENYFNTHGINNTDIMITSEVNGMLHNAVNNGDIIVDGSSTANAATFYGVSRLSGIVSMNASLITSCFNLGNIYNNNVIQDVDTRGGYASAEFEVESGGITFLMMDEYAQIRDCANNGNIFAINPEAHDYTWTNAAGIAVRNDKDENGTDGGKSTLGKIQYSINYGNVYCYNAYVNSSENNTNYGLWNETQAKAAGFSCLGVLSIVNVINYGNVYSTRTAGGMYGLIFTNKFSSQLAQNHVNIANAINYGNVRQIEVGTIPTLSNYQSITGTTQSNGSPQGALIGLLHGTSTSANLSNTFDSIVISYLINLVDDVNIIGGIYRIKTSNFNAADATTMTNTVQYMATTNPTDATPTPFNVSVNGTYSYIKSYYKNTVAPTYTGSVRSAAYNGGIFNESFPLRNPSTISTAIETNRYIADYIQFIPYSKVNDYLVQKIGLADTVLSEAYSRAYQSTNIIKSLLANQYPNEGDIDSLYNTVITNTTYYNRLAANKQTIIDATIEALSSTDYTDLEVKNILDTLLGSTNNPDVSSLITDPDVIQIVNTLFDTASDTVINNLFSRVLQDTSLIQSLIVNAPNALKLYVDRVADTIPLSSTDKSALVNIYNTLVSENDSLGGYLSSLSDAQCTTLANTLYPLVENNVDIQEAIAAEFENIQVTNSTEADIIIDQILTPRLSGQVTSISDSVYESMYYDICIESTVINTINNMDDTALTSLIDTLLSNSSNTSNNLYQFLESGRSRISDIILPANYTNYDSVVSATAYVYQTDNPSGQTVTDGQYIYTGPYSNTDKATVPSGSYQLYVYTTGTRRHTFSNNTFTYNRNNGTYRVVAATANNSTATVNSQLTRIYATRTGSWTGYSYSNVSAYQYIDYGSAAGTAKNQTITYGLMLALDNLDIATNVSMIKELLINIYNNATSNKTDFENLILNNQSMTITDKVQTLINFVNNDYNVANSICSYIYSTEARVNVVEAFGFDYGLILGSILYDLNDDDEKIKIVADMFGTGASLLSSSGLNNIDNNVIQILNSANLSVNEKRLLLQYISSSIGDILLIEAINNNSLTKAQNITLIESLLTTDLNLIRTYHTNLTNLFHKDIKESIIACAIVNSETNFRYIFETLGGNDIDDLDAFLELIETSGADIADITDYMGIYALASSYGIEDGMFIPDNIRLIDLDPYITNQQGDTINDPVWRGGTTAQPDYYNENATSDEDKNKVNYKIYYTMKQLKKSIATIVFKMELVDTDTGETPTESITNNISTDYDLSDLQDRKIYFYIPVNADILNSSTLYVNTNSNTYELSYRASFNPVADKLEITIPSVLQVGQVLSDTFMVQAEDTRVQARYTVYVTITRAYGLDPLNSVNVNGSATNATITTNTYQNADAVNITDAIVNTNVDGYNGRIRMTYTSLNMANNTNLQNKVKLYNADAITSMPASIQDINWNTYCTSDKVINDQFTWTDINNNGSVVSTTTGTGYDSTTNAYVNGTVFFDMSLSNYLPSGYYIVEIKVTSDACYHVLFYKAPSTEGNLISITYNGVTYIRANAANNNNTTTDISLHPYGTKLTEDDLYSTYYDSIEVSPLATYQITNVTVTGADNITARKVYQVTFEITSESGTTTTFTHYITDDVVDKQMKVVYLNGGIDALEEELLDGYTNNFEYNESPSYQFDYDLSNEAFLNDSNYLQVVYTDALGNEITDPTTLTILQNSVVLVPLEGVGYSVEFLEDAPAQDYYFKLVYTNNNFVFNETTTINWYDDFNVIKITKKKNYNSYLDNITFNSETVITSISTMADINEITYEEYQIMLTNPSRTITFLPNKVYYNDYEMTYENGVLTKQNEFYVIGLVNKTDLASYAPTFTLPDQASVYRIVTINSITYRYVPYYYDNNGTRSYQNYLVSEDSTTFALVDGTVISVTGNEASFTYNGITYTRSEAAGLQSAIVNGSLVINESLYTDFFEEGSYSEVLEEFNHVTYRVYSEMYQDSPTNDYYTDYKISVQDLTNNVRFFITINEDTDVNLSDELYFVFLELVCHTLMSDNITYELYNRIGIFASFNRQNNPLSIGAIQSNSSGKYNVYLSLPKGYSFTYRVTDKGIVTDYVEGQDMIIPSSITTKNVTVEILIIKATDQNDDWGQTATSGLDNK